MDTLAKLNREVETILSNSFFDETYIAQAATMLKGVKNGSSISLINAGSFKMAQGLSCNVTSGDQFGTTDDTWEIKDIIIRDTVCPSALSDLLKAGQELDTLVGNTEVGDILYKRMRKAFVEEVTAEAILGNKNNAKYGKQIDGIYTQIVAEGESASWDANGKYVESLYNLINAMPAELIASENKYIMCSYAFWQKVKQELVLTKGINISEQFNAVLGGLSTSEFDGIKVIVNPQIDTVCANLTAADATAGTSADAFYGKADKIAFITSKDAAMIASRCKDESDFLKVTLREDPATLKNYNDGVFSVGAYVADPAKNSCFLTLS